MVSRGSRGPTEHEDTETRVTRETDLPCKGMGKTNPLVGEEKVLSRFTASTMSRSKGNKQLNGQRR